MFYFISSMLSFFFYGFGVKDFIWFIGVFQFGYLRGNEFGAFFFRVIILYFFSS